jgi:glycogen debranching enzyme
MNLDLATVPFSRYGSYLAFSFLRQPHAVPLLGPSQALPEGVYLRTVRGDTFSREILRLELLQGQTPIPYTVHATPSCLRLEAQVGHVEICISEPKVIRIRGTGVSLQLTMAPGMFTYALPLGDSHWQINSFMQRMSYLLTPLVGQLVMDAPWSVDRAAHIIARFVPDAETGTLECAIEEFQSVWVPRAYSESFAACRQAVDQEYRQWLDQMPGVPPRYAAARELAAYVDWSCVVAPDGHLTRPAMYMSKNWMTNVWSWDHCFNAMALAYHNPALAWDQFMLLFDCQDAQGALPDSVNDRLMVWNFCKPPIHGWTLKRLMERTDWITTRQLREVYGPLSRWTDWWFTYRDDDHDGIPQYNHGNDSGWDNCTAFETGLPLESPDLSAFLVIQMGTLADVALRLDKPRAAKAWQKRADELLARLLAHSWRGDRFVAPRSGDHKVTEANTLFLFLPLILGEKLPRDVRSALISGLTQPDRFVTAHGLATESPASALYQPDGYWRGPIWAPSTMILVDGLAAVGEKALARELSGKFCDMAARSGMAENYDALTGAGLRDRAYTWTASVFLILAHEYLQG